MSHSVGKPQKKPVIIEPFAPWPHFEQDEIDAVSTVLKSGRVNYWTGNEVREFEKEFAAYCGCKYAVAVANGTVSLELALMALGIGAGDEVIVPSRTYVATASAVSLRGATPVFAEVDRNSQNVTVETLSAELTPKTKGIIVVHLAGWPCDMDSIMAFARKHRLAVVEDCAQAHGAEYKGQPVGSFGDAGSFSFCQDKIMTTGGEGGMLVMNNETLWEKAWSYKDHGKDYNTMHTPRSTYGYQWAHHSVGTNWRMTEMQAAIGRLQLRKLGAWIKKRSSNADYLQRSFSKYPVLRLASIPDSIQHAFYKYYTFICPEKLKPGWDRDKVMQKIGSLGVPVSAGSCSEVYREKAFQGISSGRTKPHAIAKELGETSLMFQVHPTLTDNNLKDMAAITAQVLEQATRLID